VSNESRIDAYAHALLGIAVVEGYPAEVEDELFRFARTFEGNDALRNAMVDPGLPVERRQAVVEELMGGKALTVSKALASFIVGAGRSEDLPAIVDRFVELSSEGRPSRSRASPRRSAPPRARRSKSESSSTRKCSAASSPESVTR
jgi:F-type H+-transporting ATPase subunit delta